MFYIFEASSIAVQAFLVQQASLDLKPWLCLNRVRCASDVCSVDTRLTRQHSTGLKKLTRSTWIEVEGRVQGMRGRAGMSRCTAV